MPVLSLTRSAVLSQDGSNQTRVKLQWLIERRAIPVGDHDNPDDCIIEVTGIRGRILDAHISEFDLSRPVHVEFTEHERYFLQVRSNNCFVVVATPEWK